MIYKDKYFQWLNNNYFDDETREELKNISGDEKEIEDRFYKDLEFGTGGLRGIIGAGTNRINIYTVRRATQGLCNYILNYGKEGKDKGVAIAYDSRFKSRKFAEESAKVIAGNGIKVYLFKSLRPTPELSFAVRERKCIAGVVITASHNPPEYNGYKVYWEDGGQIVSHANKIIKEVKEIDNFEDIKIANFEEGKSLGLIEILGEEMDDLYINRLKEEVINKEAIEKVGDDFKIVYTPIHGTGNIPVRRVLTEIGFKNVLVVKEQELPDPNFPTVKYPNPEEKEVFELAIELAKKENADIIMGTDPDSDRVGVVVKNNEGEYIILNGNQIGCLLTEYILLSSEKKGILPENAAIIKTIVTSPMANVIGDNYGVKVIDVLTGFKYIGEMILQFEKDNSYKYIFGFEESYGSLKGGYVRDKDAVNACMMIGEMAAYYKSNGLTLYEALVNLYEKYGYYEESLYSLTLKGKEGLEKINSILKDFRENTPNSFNGKKVVEFRDYKTGEIINMLNGTKDKIHLPESDVLYFTLEDESWIAIRPSGTEPKIKFYFGVKGDSFKDSNNRLSSLCNWVVNYVNK
ncbi:MAG: phospho-sugar mutase [Clostridiaceae bacterium]